MISKALYEEAKRWRTKYERSGNKEDGLIKEANHLLYVLILVYEGTNIEWDEPHRSSGKWAHKKGKYDELRR